jgi:hypothetical protein
MSNFIFNPTPDPDLNGSKIGHFEIQRRSSAIGTLIFQNFIFKMKSFVQYGVYLPGDKSRTHQNNFGVFNNLNQDGATSASQMTTELTSTGIPPMVISTDFHAVQLDGNYVQKLNFQLNSNLNDI